MMNSGENKDFQSSDEIHHQTAIDRWFMCMAEAGYPKERGNPRHPGASAHYWPQVGSAGELICVLRATLISGLAQVYGCESMEEVLDRWASINPFNCDLADQVRPMVQNRENVDV